MVNESRSLIISDFRNLGISALRKDRSDKTYIKINRSLRKDEIGSLVILLGGNNSGKSNVLEAIGKSSKQQFTEDDFTDFLTAPKKPSLRMDIADGKYGNIVTPKILTGIGKRKVLGTLSDVLLYILKQNESFSLFNEWIGPDSPYCGDIEWYMNSNDAFIHGGCVSDDVDFGKAYAYILRNRDDLVSGVVLDYANELEDGRFESIRNEQFEVILKGTPIDSVVYVDAEYGALGGIVGAKPRYMRKDKVEGYYANQKGIKGIARKAVNKFGNGNKGQDDDVCVMDLSGGVKETEIIKDQFSDEYGYNLSNNVYLYRRKKIENKDLVSKVSEPNDFIKKVFSLLGYDSNSIINKYYDNNNIRASLEKKLNDELVSISDDLNNLLNAKERKYELQIRLEKNEICFSVLTGSDIHLNLDHQSEGFRWIFEFFINFLMSKQFVAGDIIMIDEFGGLLNFGTVLELTKILRDFARINGITFVLATQNPMAVNIAHLDEIRIVRPREDGSSEILNDFTEFSESGSVDILKPIVGSLTVGRNYLRSENRRTVFVRTAQEYFILNGFCEYFRLKGEDIDLDFIPINGLNAAENVDDLIPFIKSIERYPVILLEESVTVKGVQIYTVSEIFDQKSVKLIDLFSNEEIDNYGLGELSFDAASCFSHKISSSSVSISDGTFDNFRRLFDYILLD